MWKRMPIGNIGRKSRLDFEVSVGNGNRIYSSVVLDQLKQLPDSTFNFDQLELDYF